MLPNAFVGKTQKPTDIEVSTELGSAKKFWDQLVSELAKQHGVDTQEWNSYSKKAGWSLRLKRKDRIIVYLSPHRGCFTASFALGDKAVEAARRSGLLPEVIKIIDGAKRYAEGTAVRIEVKDDKDVTSVVRIAIAKLDN
jgi:hypothetical protein